MLVRIADVCGIVTVCGIADFCRIADVCSIAVMGNMGGITGQTTSSKDAKKTFKHLKTWPWTLQNRGLGPPKSSLEPSKTPFLKYP